MTEVKRPALWTVFFSVLSIAYIYPIILVLINSFKGKIFINDNPFSLPNSMTFVGLDNYVQGIKHTNFWMTFTWSMVITVGSAFWILLLTSMTAWWIVRSGNRFSMFLYLLFLFSMVVPFQMVMYTLSWFTDYLGLGNPVGLWIIYLGFGAGLAVFIFTGFVKAIPYELEEAALIDGCGPAKTYFLVVFPVLKPAVITVAILEVMWLWNDYLLPYLTLDLKKYMTVPIAVQYLKGGFGTVDMGSMMAVLVLAIIPVIIFYLFSQRHIIQGVISGAVKG